MTGWMLKRYQSGEKKPYRPSRGDLNLRRLIEEKFPDDEVVRPAKRPKQKKKN